jgi:hypothetical protein
MVRKLFFSAELEMHEIDTRCFFIRFSVPNDFWHTGQMLDLSKETQLTISNKGGQCFDFFVAQIN